MILGKRGDPRDIIFSLFHVEVSINEYDKDLESNYYAVFLYFCANNGISPRTTAGVTRKADSPLLEGK